MRIGKMTKSVPECINRSEKTISYAVNQIQKSSIAPFVNHVYLYGSCARKMQNFNSDVDLFLELSEDFDSAQYRDEVLRLKGTVSPKDICAPEVDLKVVVGDYWRDSKMLYYKRVKTEGVDVWNN